MYQVFPGELKGMLLFHITCKVFHLGDFKHLNPGDVSSTKQHFFPQIFVLNSIDKINTLVKATIKFLKGRALIQLILHDNKAN